MNSGHRKASIFSLSFGDGADKTFLQKLSLRNDGFSRHIYEAADASLQLEDFYHQISSPLLSNVQFTYTPSVSNLTKTVFPILFGGSELIVAGRTGIIIILLKGCSFFIKPIKNNNKKQHFGICSNFFLPQPMKIYYGF